VIRTEMLAEHTAWYQICFSSKLPEPRWSCLLIDVSSHINPSGWVGDWAMAVLLYSCSTTSSDKDLGHTLVHYRGRCNSSSYRNFSCSCNLCGSHLLSHLSAFLSPRWLSVCHHFRIQCTGIHQADKLQRFLDTRSRADDINHFYNCSLCPLQ